MQYQTRPAGKNGAVSGSKKTDISLLISCNPFYYPPCRHVQQGKGPTSWRTCTWRAQRTAMIDSHTPVGIGENSDCDPRITTYVSTGQVSDCGESHLLIMKMGVLCPPFKWSGHTWALVFHLNSMELTKLDFERNISVHTLFKWGARDPPFMISGGPRGCDSTRTTPLRTTINGNCSAEKGRGLPLFCPCQPGKWDCKGWQGNHESPEPSKGPQGMSSHSVCQSVRTTGVPSQMHVHFIFTGNRTLCLKKILKSKNPLKKQVKK